MSEVIEIIETEVVVISDEDPSSLVILEEPTISVVEISGTIVVGGSGPAPGTVFEQIYNFPTPSTVWIATHGQTFKPVAMVLNNSGTEVLSEVDYTPTQVVITHGRPTSGTLVLR